VQQKVEGAVKVVEVNLEPAALGRPGGVVWQACFLFGLR
jgi:hypothetical protein